MTAVTDCETSYPHPSASPSLNHIYLSPGPTLPLIPSVSPLSPLHIENTLVSPVPMSLIPSPSHMLGKMGPTSPQHQPIPALHHGVRSEASQSQLAYVPALATQPLQTHTATSQNTHPPTNGSTQPLKQVIMLATMEYGVSWSLRLLYLSGYFQLLVWFTKKKVFKITLLSLYVWRIMNCRIYFKVKLIEECSWRKVSGLVVSFGKPLLIKSS